MFECNIFHSENKQSMEKNVSHLHKKCHVFRKQWPLYDSKHNTVYEHAWAINKDRPNKALSAH